MRLTIACPKNQIAIANELAMALAFSTADGETFKQPSWEDQDGNLYAAASLEVTQGWIENAQSNFDRPLWDTEEQIDMSAAKEAQTLLNFWVTGSDQPIPQANPNEIVAIGGINGLQALAAIGLTKIQEEPE